MNTDKEALDRLRKAQARLCSPMLTRTEKKGDFQYFAPFIFALRFIERPLIPTMSLGTFPYVYFNADYVKERTVRELAGLLLKMVLVTINKHDERRGNRDPWLWALAVIAEGAENIMDSPRVGLPEESIYGGYWGLEPDLPAEKIYRELQKMDEIPLPWSAFGPDGSEIDPGFKLTLGDLIAPLMPGSGLLGEQQPWEDQLDTGLTPGDEPRTPISGYRVDPFLYERLMHEVREELSYHLSTRIGTVPDWVLRLAGIKRKPVNWRAEMQRQVRRAHAHGAGVLKYSFRRPHPAQLALKDDFVLPIHELRSARVAIVTDTSGSMGADELAYARGQIEGVLRQLCSRDGVIVIPTDWTAKNAQKARSAGEVEMIGGGGTNMGEGIRAAELLRPRPDAVIVITDGYTGWPKHPSRHFATIIVNVSKAWSKHHKKSFPAPNWARVIEMFPAEGNGDQPGHKAA